MTIVSAKRLRQSLDKARNAGFVEDEFDIMGVHIAIRSLRPDEYEAILSEAQEEEEVAYVFAFQKLHVAYALIQVDEVDLRGVTRIEDEVEEIGEDGKPFTRTVKFERPVWIMNNVVGTWSKEMVSTVYRKFSELVGEAERKAHDGVKFLTPDESDEEKLRRLLGEARELETTMPPTLTQKVLDDLGYTHKVTVKEMAAADEKLASVEREGTGDGGVDLSEVMKRRTPLNRAGAEVTAEVVDPQDMPQRPVPQRQPQVPQRPVPQRPPQVPPQAAGAPARRSRAEEIAALEGLPQDAGNTTLVHTLPGQDETAEIRSEKVDPRAFASTLDRPPVGGINPRFHRGSQ